MRSMKIVQFSVPLSPLVHLRPKLFYSLDFGHPISNAPPSLPSPNDNQSIKRKRNPRMTIICYQDLPSGKLSPSVSIH